MLLDDNQYKEVWDRVYDELKFHPYTAHTGICPFTISHPHVIFDISGTESRMVDDMITSAFVACVSPGEKMYALDWQHSAFLFDPRDPSQMESFYTEDFRHFGGGYHVEFPPYYPDGDYYFFIDENFRFGYLSHPWRREVWIFGACLITEFKKIYREFGWEIKEEHSV